MKPSPDDPRIFICKGPPWCLLEDDAAVRCQQADCPLCKVITIHADGTETVKEPREN